MSARTRVNSFPAWSGLRKSNWNCTVSAHAARLNVPVVASEIVGLVPQDSLPPNPVARLKLEAFDPRQILENRLAA